MKKLNYLLILVVLLLAGCGSPIPEEPEKYKNTNVDIISDYAENTTNSDNVPTSDSLDDDFIPKDVTSDVHFFSHGSLEFEHYFVTDRKVIRDDKDYSQYEGLKEGLKDYTYGSIDIAETTITGCVAQGTYGDWNHIDESVTGCTSTNSVGYSITIPGGTYKAYYPTDATVTTCSLTNPIVCWGYRSAEEVRVYYAKNRKCPSSYVFYNAGVAGPTDVCAEGFWYCSRKVCGANYCDIKEGVSCSWQSLGGKVALGDPCDFFLGMGMAPADGSCDHKLK